MQNLKNLEEDLSSLSFDANKSQRIIWNHESNTGIVQSPKGNTWNTIGILTSGNAHVFVEEALFLCEFGGFELVESGSNSHLKLGSIEELMRLVKQDCGFNSYKLFKTLKKHGYILMRPECKYFLKPRLFQILRGEYSLFKPSSSFKKTSPFGLIGRVIEIKPNDKFCEIIENLESLEDTAVLAISDDFNSFCFLEAAIINPVPASNNDPNYFQPKPE